MFAFKRWIEKVFHYLKLFLNVLLDWKSDEQILAIFLNPRVSVASRLHAEGRTGLAHSPEDTCEPVRVQRDAIKKIAQYGKWIRRLRCGGVKRNF